MRDTIVGTVISGNHLGRLFGFPTANLALRKGTQVPFDEGVYAALTTVGRTVYPSVVNIGRSPSIITGGDVRVEVHIIGFGGDLYGHKLSVKLVERIRSEARFASQAELIAQIARDRDLALEILQRQ